MIEREEWHKNGHQAFWQNLEQRKHHYDIVVIGGGITGAGIAREAVKHGQKVLLVERQDFAWGTSSRSSKMVHGGLRYMAQGDFKTTRQSVHERERLLKEAPGLVELMTYSMPHYKGQFPPPFLFNILLAAYDFFAGKKYRRFEKAEAFTKKIPLLESQDLLGATLFADAVTDDSRLVMRVLHEAITEGADCINYVGAKELLLEQGEVVGVRLQNALTNEELDVHAAAVINATGAWADELRGQLQQPKKIRPARGSHFIVSAERLPIDQSITILHPKDKRPVFIYPWEGRTVIGTTDIDHGQLTNTEASISVNEFSYLLELAQHYFPEVGLSEKDVISSFSGVRPLISSGALNPSKEKRNHSVWVEKGLISVSGGKLTTFRIIAQDTLKKAKPRLANWKPSKDESILKPAHCQHQNFDQLEAQTQQRLLGFYGSNIRQIIQDIDAEELTYIADTPMLWAELRFAARFEAVQHLDDLLLRRTRLGLLLPNGAAGCFEKIQVICQQELGWNEQTWQEEVERYQGIIAKHYSLPVVA